MQHSQHESRYFRCGFALHFATWFKSTTFVRSANRGGGCETERNIYNAFPASHSTRITHDINMFPLQSDILRNLISRYFLNTNTHKKRQVHRPCICTSFEITNQQNDISFVQWNKTFRCLFHSKKHTTIFSLFTSLSLSLCLRACVKENLWDEKCIFTYVKNKEPEKKTNKRVNCCELRIVNVVTSFIDVKERTHTYYTGTLHRERTRKNVYSTVRDCE